MAVDAMLMLRKDYDREPASIKPLQWPWIQSTKLKNPRFWTSRKYQALAMAIASSLAEEYHKPNRLQIPDPYNGYS
jgi:hypothetical protein